jgi:hypothetical protein
MQKLVPFFLLSACVPVTTQLRPPMSWNVGDSPIAASAGDLNGDGKIDLVVSKGISNASTALLAPAEGELSVLFGRGDGTFVQGWHTVGRGVPRYTSIVDLNGDGKPEIVVAGLFSGPGLHVFMNQGNGTFVQNAQVVGVGDGAMHVRAADFNGDGKMDLAMVEGRPEAYGASEFVAGRVVILTGRGDGTFDMPRSWALGRSATGLTIADLNGDGKLDLAVPDELRAEVNFMYGRGDGTFDDPVAMGLPFRPAGVTAVDFDKDNRADLIIGTVDGFMALRNNGGGFSVCASVYSEPTRSVVIGDFDRDGNADVAVGRRLVRGNGACGFTGAQLPDAHYNDSLVTSADLNGDGWLDVIAADRAHNSIHVYLNAGGTAAPAPVKSAKR